MSKNVRIIANANNKNLKTANIVTSGGLVYPTREQTVADDRTFKTIQDSGGSVIGLPTIIVPGYSGGGGGGYVGPLDLTTTPALIAYGNRALSAAKVSSAFCTVRRTSDDTTQEFSFGADGLAPLSSMRSFVGAQTLKYVTLVDGGTGYDSGNGIDASTFDVTIVGGTGTAAVVNVTTSSNGDVTIINSITQAGSYSAPPNNSLSTTGDDGVNHGSGLKLAGLFSAATVSSWKDQSGNGSDVVQATAIHQPELMLTTVPALDFTGSGDASGVRVLSTASDVTLASGTATLFAVINMVNNRGGDELCGVDFEDQSFGHWAFEFSTSSGTALTPIIAINDNSGNNIFAQDNIGSGSVPLNSQVLFEAVANNVPLGNPGGKLMLFNGVPQTWNIDNSIGTTPGPISGIFNIGSDDTLANSTESFSGMVIEYIVFDSAVLSGAERLAIRQNIAAAHGITLA